MRVEFPGPAGRLEGLLEEPEEGDPLGVAVLCHPHPLHEGSYRNTIVYRTARALRSVGVVSLRINFRGVGESQGIHDGNGGEEEDARAALDYLGERYPGSFMWAGGYSFGARTVSSLAVSEPRIQRLFLAALPVAFYECTWLPQVQVPSLLVFGGEDEFGTKRDFERRFPALGDHFQVEEVPGADHFFRGHTPVLEEHMRRYALEGVERIP